MPRLFQDGDEVVWKGDRGTCLTVVGYTGEGLVSCRRQGREGSLIEEYKEAELERQPATPPVGFGRVEGDPSDYPW